MGNQMTRVHRTLTERLADIQASTNEAHADALLRVRQDFETRLVQAIAYKVNQALDVITGD